MSPRPASKPLPRTPRRRPAHMSAAPNPTTVTARGTPPSPVAERPPVAVTTDRPDRLSLVDEHSVLVWQTCAYATDLIEASQRGGRLHATREAMLGFLHYGLLPFLRDEERQLPNARANEHRTQKLLDEHCLIRADVEALESIDVGVDLAPAARVLVNRLDRHVQREDAWVDGATLVTRTPATMTTVAAWVLPLVSGPDIDLDILPVGDTHELVASRLATLRVGDTVRLHAGYDLHPLWQRLHTRCPGSHAWVYEKCGPHRWIARVTRHERE